MAGRARREDAPPRAFLLNPPLPLLPSALQEKERLRKAKEALYPTVKKAPSLRTIDSGLSWEDSASFCEGWK